MKDIAPKIYENVSLHVGVINVRPQFCATIENVGYGTSHKLHSKTSMCMLMEKDIQYP